MEKFNLFSPLFNNDELEEEFNNFFYKYNLVPLFTNEHRTSPITVTYLDARSTVKPGGSYHEQLKDFSDVLNMANDNKMYESSVFKIIYQAKTFQSLMKNIKKVKEYIESDIDEKHLFNTWNIVWYNKEVY